MKPLPMKPIPSRPEDMVPMLEHAGPPRQGIGGRVVHRRIGEAIESLLAHQIGEYVETLAYHFQRAGEIDKAVRYAIAAGKRAFERHVLDDAEGYFRSGYELLDGLNRTSNQDRLLVELLVEWTEVLSHDLKQREAGRLLERHWPLAERLNDPELTTRFRSLMLLPYWADLDFEDLESHLRWMDGQARAGVSRYSGYAACMRSMRDFVLVDPESGLAHAVHALSLPNDAVDRSWTLVGKTIHLLALRRYEEAGQNASLHLEFHRERPAEYCESMVRAQAAGVAAVQGEPGKGLATYLSEVALRARRGASSTPVARHGARPDSRSRRASSRSSWTRSGSDQGRRPAYAARS